MGFFEHLRVESEFCDLSELNEKNYYITTPIYYVNGLPHVGTALTTVACDALARYQRLRGRTAFLLTGTDENATKVQEAAQKANVPTMEYVDGLAAEFQKAWDGLHIQVDSFERTTSERHKFAVQTFFERLRERELRVFRRLRGLVQRQRRNLFPGQRSQRRLRD